MTRSAALLLLSLSIVMPACNAERGESSTTADDSGDLVVAHVGNETITLAELEEQARPELIRLEMERYDKLREVLDAMGTDRLLKREAAARGMTPEELIQAEVTDKIGEPADSEIQAFYQRNKPRIGDRELDDIRDVVIQQIKKNKAQSYRIEFIASLKNSAGFRIELDPPRAEVAVLPDDLSRGAEDAPITIIEFADFECPYCRRAHPTMERLLVEYGEKIQFVFRDYPLSIHPRAVRASHAARCASDQDKFWDYYQHLMVMQGDLGEEDLKKRASEVGLDLDRFSACIQSDRHVASIQALVETGKNLGITGTPTFFINGRRVVGSKTYEELKAIIEDELVRAESIANVGG